MATLISRLPAPMHRSVDVADDDEDQVAVEVQTHQLSISSSTAVVATSLLIPAYGSRNAWKPRRQEDFGDGGAYPECAIAQYPCDMGRKKHSSSGSTLALTVDGEGKVDYSKIATQGHRDGRIVQSQFKDLVPLEHRTDISTQDREMQRPSEESIHETANRTKLALEKITQGKIKAAQPQHLDTNSQVSYVRYTPNSSGAGGSGQVGKQRIIKMVEVVEDPLEPPRFKGKKIPKGPPSPPAPILRSPPRKVSVQEQKDWMIPPCISNWKNNKGYTIPLDKRLAADGRGLQDVHINDRFAQFSEALYVADRHAREEVRQRSLMQQRIAQKEKEKQEDNFRLLAQRAREERSGVVPRMTAAASMPAALAGYGSDDDSEAGDSDADTETGSVHERPTNHDKSDEEDGEGDERAAKARDELRRERRRSRERQLRMNNMGTEKRVQTLARTQNRDISEKIALGLAKPTMSKEAMMDSRLYNQEQFSGTFGDDDAYHLYDKPLFASSSAAAAIYKTRMPDEGDEAGGEEQYGGGTEEGISRQLKHDRFGLGVAGKGFEGADVQEVREGPVQFERDTADPFAINAFLNEATKGTKRGGGDGDDGGGKRRKE